MAITNTRAVQRIETYPAQNSSAEDTTNEGNATLMVVYENTFDDANDDSLPVTTHTTKHLLRYSVTVAEDGTQTSTATDVSGEDAMVQAVCGAVWTD